MLKILITGFGPFPGFDENPSETLVRNLNPRVPGTEIVKEIVPTEWERSRILFDTATKIHAPNLLIHFGVGLNEGHLKLERCAKNFAADRPDASGSCPSANFIDPNGPSTYQTNLPLIEIADELTNELFPAQISDDAGDYLCNYLYYLSLNYVERKANERTALFIHIPPEPAIDAKVNAAADKLIHLCAEQLTKLTGTSAA